ncbi:hypothetical protein [Sulfurimonas sp.]|uniref:hypothetical protein n=1 Tax=Sulfurimonas sp. TaxID=2022749 RepID=UPI00286E72A0|nr:hypothetical protein [Sulfurimonas sp.]
MKYLALVGAILAVLAVTIFVVAFTPLGNSLLKPIVEGKIKEETKLESKLETFLFTMSDFEVVLELNKENIIKAKGKYSLFSQAFELSYEVALKNLESLEPLTTTALNGAFYTDGSAKGDLAFFEIDGKSDVGESNTSYHIELTDLKPTSIVAQMKDAKLASLLYLGAQNPYATADIDLDINFKKITPHLMDGDIVLSTKNGNINPEFMKSDFNVTISDTPFSMNIDAKLKGDDIDYNYDFASNLFKISSAGRVVPEPFYADLKYSLDIKELEVLKPITSADVRGAFKVNGTLKGTKESLVAVGSSDMASSDTTFEAILKDFAPVSIKAKVANLNIAKFLYMLKEPHYADGVLFMDADIKDARSDKLDGQITTSIKKGVLDSKYLTKKYEFKSTMPATTYKSTTISTLNGNSVDTKVDFNSNIANIDIKSAKYNMEDGSLKSDYVINIADLEKLFFVTDQHMKGTLAANGELSKAKDLDLTFHTKVAGGKIDVKLHNDDFHADLSNIQTTQLLHMLMYRELFASTLKAKLDYNMAKDKGVFSGHVKDAVFAENQVFDLIEQYVKFDMYRENFNGDIGAKINKDDLLISLDLRSKEASIITKDTKLNTKTQQIDSDITIQAKKDGISANLNGDVDSPKVRVDLEKFLKSEAGKKVIEKVNEKVDKLFKKLF